MRVTNDNSARRLVTSIFSFSPNVFNLIKDKSHHLSQILYLSFENAFNLVWSKILPFGKELNYGF